LQRLQIIAIYPIYLTSNWTFNASRKLAKRFGTSRLKNPQLVNDWRWRELEVAGYLVVYEAVVAIRDEEDFDRTERDASVSKEPKVTPDVCSQIFVLEVEFEGYLRRGHILPEAEH